MKYYFVYGALMGWGKFKTQGLAATLPGYRVAFSIKTNMKIEPSFATLVAADGHCAHGVIAKLSDKEWARISRHEVSYSLHKVTVLSQAGEKTECWTLVNESVDDIVDIPPSSRYAKLLYKAALWHNLDKRVIEKYYHYMRYGSKFTRIMWPLMPLIRWLSPYIPPRYTLQFLWYALPILAVIALLALCYCLF